MNKIWKVMASVCCALAVLFTYTMPAKASNYQHVTRTTSYAHPDTGEIVDGGSKANEALGNSMCDGIVDDTVLIEKSGGKTYVTLGIGLMSNIESVSFYVAKSGQTDPSQFQRVSAKKVGSCQRDGDTCYHYRFELPSGTKYISPKIYVTPMGREVQFFVKLNMSSISDGRGDFDHGQAAPVKPAKKPAKKPSKPAKSESTKPTKDKSDKVVKKDKEDNDVAKIEDQKEKHEDNKKQKDQKADDQKGSEDQKVVDNEKVDTQDSKEEANEKTTSYAIPITIGTLLVVIGVAGGLYLKKRKG